MTASPEETAFIPIGDFPLEVFGESAALGIHHFQPPLPAPQARLTPNLTLLFLVVVIGLRGGEKFTFGFQWGGGTKTGRFMLSFPASPAATGPDRHRGLSTNELPVHLITAVELFIHQSCCD